MTVPYSECVRKTDSFAFIRLFFRWRGNVWKAIYKELLLWLFFYSALNASYRWLMSDEQKRKFERVCTYFRRETEHAIPITFMLGFFVSLVFHRWWTMWTHLGWIDNVALFALPLLFLNFANFIHAATYIPGRDERSRMFRRNIVRYLLALQVIVFRDISTGIRDRFPELRSLVNAGYLTEEERIEYVHISSSYKNYYLPWFWATSLVVRARKEGLIPSDHDKKDLLGKISELRGQFSTLLSYDFQAIPLLYTVVVCLTVRLYFLVALVAQQSFITQADSDKVDLYVPVVTLLQFLFYFGWLKVAEAMLNPFGDDDDDFECNWLIDRNLEVGYIIVDELVPDNVELVRDPHWNSKRPMPMYSTGTLKAAINPLVGSASRRASVFQSSRKGSMLLPATGGRPPAILPGDIEMHQRIAENSNEDNLNEKFLNERGNPDQLIDTFRRKLSQLIGLDQNLEEEASTPTNTADNEFLAKCFRDNNSETKHQISRKTSSQQQRLRQKPRGAEPPSFAMVEMTTSASRRPAPETPRQRAQHKVHPIAFAVVGPPTKGEQLSKADEKSRSKSIAPDQQQIWTSATADVRATENKVTNSKEPSRLATTTTSAREEVKDSETKQSRKRGFEENGSAEFDDISLGN